MTECLSTAAFFMAELLESFLHVSMTSHAYKIFQFKGLQSLQFLSIESLLNIALFHDCWRQVHRNWFFTYYIERPIGGGWVSYIPLIVGLNSPDPVNFSFKTWKLYLTISQIICSKYSLSNQFSYKLISYIQLIFYLNTQFTEKPLKRPLIDIYIFWIWRTLWLYRLIY